MQNLKISNFGPINKVDLDIQQQLIFIGPQASGKSTISKNIYFFKSIRDDLIKFGLDEKNFENDIKNTKTRLTKHLKLKFLHYWGSTYAMSPFRIEYNYGNNKIITIRLDVNSDKGYVSVDFNPEIYHGLMNFFSKAKEFHTQKQNKLEVRVTSIELIALKEHDKYILTQVTRMANDIFEDEKSTLFIPAGRSLLSTLSDQFQNVDQHKLDYLMADFVEKINVYKLYFRKPLDELLMDKKKLSSDKIKFNNVNAAKALIEKILKGNYTCDADGEKIYINQEKFVKLIHSSSGQQESVWILLLIFMMILEDSPVYLIFEEPEAHLFPEAQKNLVELFAIVLNTNEQNQITITTHSPYILSSFNNLLYANELGIKKNGEVNKIINRLLWVDQKTTEVFLVNEGEIKSIKDPETGLIELEAIDSASKSINADYAKLFELDNNGLTL